MTYNNDISKEAIVIKDTKRIVIPQKILDKIILDAYLKLFHHGVNALYEMMKKYFYGYKIKEAVKK